MQIGEISVERGTRKKGAIKVVRMATGEDLNIRFLTLAGRRSGPTLTLMCTSHGSENFPIDIIREIMETTKTEELAGTLVAVPVMNPLAFQANSRCTPEMFNDKLNLNRFFPGDMGGRVNEMIAYKISQEIVKKSDCVIDFHGGEHRLNINYTYIKKEGGDLGQRLVELSKVFGHEALYLGPFFGGSVSEYAVSLGIPCITPEIGTETVLTRKYQEIGVRGVRNVMKHLGMIGGEPIKPKKQFMVTRRTRAACPAGGIWYPETYTDFGGLDLVNTLHKKGEVLARVMSPYTFEELARVEAPFEPSYITYCRGRSQCNPGEAGLQICDFSTVKWIIKPSE